MSTFTWWVDQRRCYRCNPKTATRSQVQELHGTPWESQKHTQGPQASAPGKLAVPTPLTTPMLSPSSSIASALDSEGPRTPSQQSVDGYCADLLLDDRGDFGEELQTLPQDPPPKFTRRASHDLFECIEQSKHKRLTENQAPKESSLSVSVGLLMIFSAAI